MDAMKKPEWFEIVESDGPKPIHNVKRGFRAMALSIPLMAIGIGVIVAQSSNNTPALAETSVAIASAAPSVAQSLTPSLTSADKQPKAAIATPPLPSTYADDDDQEEDD